MKNYKKIFIRIPMAIITFLTFGIFFISSISAQTTVQPTSVTDTTYPTLSGDPKTNVLTQYVSVQNNQYVLNIPNNKDIPETVIQAANAEINASNLLITKSKLIINPQTLTAEKNVTPINNINLLRLRKSESTGILKIGWNYVRIALREMITVGSASAIGAIGFFATGPMDVALVDGVAAYVGFKAAGIKKCVIFDFNTISHTVSNLRYQ